jgi:hypothetical protein
MRIECDLSHATASSVRTDIGCGDGTRANAFNGGSWMPRTRSQQASARPCRAPTCGSGAEALPFDRRGSRGDLQPVPRQ